MIVVATVVLGFALQDTVWNGYKGRSIVTRNHVTVEACAEALKVRGPGIYTCRTSVKVIVSEYDTPKGVALSWTPPTQNTDSSELTDLAGYVIYYGSRVETLNLTVKVDNPSLRSYLVQGLSAGQWYFSLRAVNSKGVESPPSNVVTKVIQ